MLFNSPVYFLIFLPFVVVCFFLLAKINRMSGVLFLVASSFAFYAYWSPKYLILLFLSIVINYFIGNSLIFKKIDNSFKRILLIVGVILNVVLLGYYKYANFFVDNANEIFGLNITISTIILPLAISFFTFQQIAYLVDSYRGIIKDSSFTSYCLFVSFFPQLIAGPIVNYKEVLPQYKSQDFTKINWTNINKGLFIFALGLFKKVVIADHFSNIADMGFNNAIPLSFLESWIVSLSYSLQIYFDFSGYADMAIGSALMFNVQLPINFNSPYKALNIQDFWRRWHMTLSRWLRDYLYIPLGGNRLGNYRTFINLFLTFLLGGLWHGAAWTFVIWGSLHGLALCFYKIWSSYKITLPNWIAWFLMFVFINITWVFFRANDVHQALSIIKSMFDVTNITVSFNFFETVYFFINEEIPKSIVNHSVESYFNEWTFLAIIICYVIVLTRATTVNYINSITQHNVVSKKSLLFLTFIAVIAIYMSLIVSSRVFLYFNF